jgi:hypothetical protein
MSDVQPAKPASSRYTFENPGEQLKPSLVDPNAQTVTWADACTSCCPEEGEEGDYSFPAIAGLKPVWVAVLSCLEGVWKSLCDWIASLTAPADAPEKRAKTAYKALTLRSAQVLPLVVNAGTGTGDSQIFKESAFYELFIPCFTYYHCFSGGLVSGDFLKDFEKLPGELKTEIRLAYRAKGSMRADLPTGVSEELIWAEVDTLIDRDRQDPTIKDTLMRAATQKVDPKNMIVPCFAYYYFVAYGSGLLKGNFVEDFSVLPDDLKKEIRDAYCQSGDLRGELTRKSTDDDVDALLARDNDSQVMRDILLKWIHDPMARAKRDEV